jgi:hypothetical protein
MRAALARRTDMREPPLLKLRQGRIGKLLDHIRSLELD